MFSKFANVNGNTIPFTYIDYANKEINMKKYTIPELKTVARAYKLPVSGTKSALLERLETYFKQSIYAICIQKNIRRHFVKRSAKLRGEAAKNRSKCVNDTDFFTMEPLCDIPLMSFFSYTDENGYVYGFDILSLLKWLKQKPVFINPYNREKISNETKNQLFQLCRLIKIMHASYLDKETISIVYPNYNALNTVRVYRPRVIRRLAIVSRDTGAVSPEIENVVIQTNVNANDISGGHMVPTIIRNNEAITITNSHYHIRNREQLLATTSRLREIQSKPIATRITELFMEIDSLGNYTQSIWFSNLEPLEYIMLYRNLYSIWHFHGIPHHVKQMITPLRDPFVSGVFPRATAGEMTRTYVQEVCLKIMEELVFTGMDEEHRKLGALHTLRGLTMVSFPARQSLPWLYESMQ